MPAAPTPAPGGARPTPRAPGGMPAAPAQSGARPSSRIPGQEVSGPITRGQPTRPDQSTSGAPTGVRAPGTTTSNLRRGSSGSDVSGLQQMLIDKGYDLGDTGADGKFGPRTAAAVKQFQTDFGLQVDGIAGDQTMSALNRAQGGARPTVGAPGGMPAASPATGGRGDGNTELQRRRGYQDGLDAARPPASNNVPPTRFNPSGTVDGPGQRARPGGTINPNPLPGTPRFNPSGTVDGPGQRARPGGTINPNPLPGTPRFNPSGTVAGPGQAARPGGTPRPVTPPRTTGPR
jgi:peptidoglycan hydrolase-like protein with peptidoglycan-binding domain